MYHLTTAVNARGQSTGVTYGNGVTASFTYGDDTGWLTDNTIKKGSTIIQDYSYGFDVVGNVKTRDILFGVGSSANLTETFEYDNLHRLERRVVNSALNLSGALAMTESYGYDAMGNLTSKPGVGNYSFSYDANGNVTNDSKRTFTYTAFEKPSRIQQNNDYTDFEYGPNRELIKRIDKRGTNITTTLMLDGYEQVTLPTGVVEHKYSVGEAIITKRSNGANETYYLHKDQQGSTTAITNAAGNTVQQLMYDPWGKQYVVNTSLLTYTSPATSKGYTGHEMVNDFEVIHMGGRTYNPVLGRFMQADPFIQSPTNLQSYNRYSYVLNNPMSYTDPSGYFSWGKVLNPMKSITRAILGMIPQNVGNFLIGVGSKICLAWAGACAAAATYEFSRAHGMSRSGALRAAAAAGVAAYAFGKVADSFGAASDANIGALADASASGFDSIASNLHSFGGNLLTAGQIAGQVTAHAVVGGIVSSIGGGKFGHGFFSAGVTKGLGTPISDNYGQGAIGGTITSMVIGGTASVISGGKFANGARTAAYQYLFNYARSVNYGQIWRDVKRGFSEHFDFHTELETKTCNQLAGMNCIPLAVSFAPGLVATGALAVGRTALAASMSKFSMVSSAGITGYDLISGKGRLIDVVSLGSQAGFMYIDEVVTPWLPAPIRLPFQQTINMLDQGSAYLYRQASGGN